MIQPPTNVPPEPEDIVEKCLWKARLPPDTLDMHFTPECAQMIGLLLQGWTTRQIGEKLGIPHGNVMRKLRDEGAEPEWVDDQPRNQVMERILLPPRVRPPDLHDLPGRQAPLRPDEPIPLEVPPDVITPAEHGEGIFGPDWREHALADRKERNEIEDNAVNAVKAYYSGRGYDVVSVESENKGWDLECRKNGEAALRVEVKGTKASDVRVELTPNEYKKSRAPGYRDSYRLAVVRNALDPNRKCAIYEKDGENWRRPASEGGNDNGAPDSLMMERVDAAIVRERRDSDK